MKRTTIILILIAAGLASFVYVYEVRHGKPRDEPSETGKPAFTFKSEDLASLTLTRAGQKMVMENFDGKWVIKAPVNTPADQTAVGSLVNDITGARIERSLAASADDLKSYGLHEPTVIVEVKLRSGEQHSIRLGTKDFSGLSAYAQIDGAKDVALVPSSLLTDADKPLNDLRDRSVLGVSQYEVSELTIQNEHGRLTLTKREGDWMIKSPIETLADDGEMSSLLSEISSAKAVDFVSESTEDLKKYGLDKPTITINAQLQAGGERALTVGSKAEDHYFAKNSAQPQIFKVESSLYERLNTQLSALRDKQVVKLNKEELTRVRITNPNVSLVAEKDKDGKWVIKEPSDKKDKEAQSWRIFDPLETNKATEILDRPPASMVAKLRKPAVEVILTGKDGKVTSLQISAAEGDQVYVRVVGRPEIYKVGKQMLDSLSFKAADVVL